MNLSVDVVYKPAPPINVGFDDYRNYQFTSTFIVDTNDNRMYANDEIKIGYATDNRENILN